jgi:hypothetical protein
MMADDGRNQREARRVLLAHSARFHGCAVCGIELDAILVVAHLDNNPSNNDPDNLAWLCPTHHWMTDHKLYEVETIKALRDNWQVTAGRPDHGDVMKDAGPKSAAARRRSNAERRRAGPQQSLFHAPDDC